MGNHNVKEVLSVLMLSTPSNCSWPFSYHAEMVDLSCFVRFLLKKNWHKNWHKSVLNNMASTSGDSWIDKPQCGCPKRAELTDVNINTGAQSISRERVSLKAAWFSLVTEAEAEEKGNVSFCFCLCRAVFTSA